MVTGIFPRKILRAAVCGICLGVVQTALASSVLTSFDFDDDSGGFRNGPDLVAVGLTVPGWYAATGSVADFGGVEGRALAARNFAAGNALVLDIGIAPGFSVDLSTVAFDHLASASGPTGWALHVSGAEIVAGSTPSSFERFEEVLDLTGLSGTVRIELRGAGASSSNGTYRVDNFVLGGAVSAVPLPGALVLAASAAGLLPLVGGRRGVARGSGFRGRFRVSPFPPRIE